MLPKHQEVALKTAMNHGSIGRKKPISNLLPLDQFRDLESKFERLMGRQMNRGRSKVRNGHMPLTEDAGSRLKVVLRP